MQRALQLLCLALAASAVSADLLAPGPAPAGRGDFDVRNEWTSVLDLITKKADDANGTGYLAEAINTVVEAGLLPAELVTDLDAGNWTGTVLAPTDEAFLALGETLDAVLADPAQLADIIAYHLIPGKYLTLGDVKAADGSIVDTLLAGDQGKLQVKAAGTKAKILTTSGQAVPVYQYNLGAGQAVVHTIKEVLFPGTVPLGGAAGTPAAAPAAY